MIDSASRFCDLVLSIDASAHDAMRISDSLVRWFVDWLVGSFVHSCDQIWHHRSPSSVHSPRGGGWRGKQVPNNNKASETRTPKSPSGRTWSNFGGKASERAQPSPPPGKRYSLTPFRQKLAEVGLAQPSDSAAQTPFLFLFCLPFPCSSEGFRFTTNRHSLPITKKPQLWIGCGLVRRKNYLI